MVVKQGRELVVDLYLPIKTIKFTLSKLGKVFCLPCLSMKHSIGLQYLPYPEHSSTIGKSVPFLPPLLNAYL